MIDPNNIGQVINNAIAEALRERGHLNILIAGRTGVGKSTLVNSVFQGRMAETGQGRPVTKNTREITKQGIPLTIFDTRGLEMSAYQETIEELESLVKERNGDRDSNRHIHLAWLCIQEDGRRVEEGEIALHEMLDNHLPILGVVTKARTDQGFRSEVQKLLPKMRNVMRVRAIAEKMDDGHELPPMGLVELIEATSELVPEAKRRALSASQRASLKYKKDRSHMIVAAATASATEAGAVPIPFADAAILVPIQVGMLAGISAAFGMEVSKGALTTLVTSAIGAGGAAFAGRAIVTNLLKLIPGVGSIAGGAIAAGTAGTMTAALGESYIYVLGKVYEKDPDAQPDMEDVGSALNDRIKLKKAN